MRRIPLFLFLVLIGATLSQASPFAPLRAGFGISVAAADGRVFVGEPANTMRPGIVYIYEKEGEEWSEVQQLQALDATIGDGFGYAVAAHGSTLLVSSTQGGGMVYAFERGADGMFSLTGSQSGAQQEGFGATLAIDGMHALVGAPMADDGAGAAYLFSLRGAEWTSIARLGDDSLVEGDRFGSSVAIDAGHILVGAPNVSSRRGAAFAFRVQGDAVEAIGKMQVRDLGAGSRYGSAVSLHAGTAAVGAPMAAGSIGSVMTYRWEDEGGWVEGPVLVPFAQSRGLQFGAAVSIAGDGVWVGVPGAARFDGAFHLFALNGDSSDFTGAFVQRSASSERGGRFGTVVAVSPEVVVAGLPGAGGRSGVAVLFEPGPHGGVWAETTTLQSAVEGLERVSGSETRCIDGKAADFSCDGMDLLAFVPTRELGGDRGVGVNDIWGWTDPQTGREYALLGRTDGMSFVDVTDPVNPVYVGDLPMTKGSQPAAWRDMKVYRDHVFVVADGAGQHGMQVLDLGRLREFSGTPLELDEDIVYDKIASAHNVVINTDTGFAYTVGNSSGGETCGGGLHMIDIRDPQSPKFAGCFGHEGTGRAGTGYNHDAQCVVYHGPDAEYQGHEICFGSAETALSIADVTDRDNPVPISSASYPNVSYAHQGWVTEDHKYFYSNDELDETGGKAATTRTLIWDITDLDDPQLIKEHFSEQRATDHNLYIRGNYMYQSNYKAGLRVLDITDPANPVEVAHFDTTPFGDNDAQMAGSWSNYPYFESGTIVVSSIGEGLFVLRQQQLDL